MHVEIVAFGRRLLTVLQLDKLEEETEEEPEAEEQSEPAHYIPTPMEVRAPYLGFQQTGYDAGFDKEVN